MPTQTPRVFDPFVPQYHPEEESFRAVEPSIVGRVAHLWLFHHAETKKVVGLKVCLFPSPRLHLSVGLFYGSFSSSLSTTSTGPVRRTQLYFLKQIEIGTL